MKLAGLCVGLLLSALALPVTARDLVLLSMSDAPAKEMRRFQPMADYLAEGLQSHGITSGRVVIVPDIAAAALALRERRADIIIASPYPILAISEAAGTRTVLRRWKNGKVEYHSLFVTRSDSPLRSLADLKGRSLAFETLNSTSAYFLPTALLTAEGFRVRDARSGPPATKDEIAYSFSGAPDNTAAWVLQKRVDAAVIGIHDWEDLKPTERAQMRILHSSKPVPRQLVSLRGDLEPRLAAGIVERLKAMESTPQGREQLQAFENTTRFDDVPEPTRQILEQMRRLISQGGARKP